ELEAIPEAERLLARAEREGDHAAEAARHLPHRERVVRVAREARVPDALDGRVLLEKARHLERVRRVPLHPQRERAQAAQEVEGDLWIDRCAELVRERADGR